MENQEKTIHPFETANNDLHPRKIVGVSILTILAGVLTGFVIANISKYMTSKNSFTSDKSVKESAGVKDKKTFKDKAEGILKEGGVDGEGQFHLERSGGQSQNVYLTSTTVDLSKYLNKKVRVWGETFKGEKAGWLMDVGFVEVL